MSLIDVDHLSVDFGRRRVPAVRDVSFSLQAGERLGLIGESGSGKSVTALAIMGLLPENAHVSGQIRVAGQQIVGADERVLARLRGAAMTMVFQEPMTALDPTMRAGRQVAEVLRLHHGAETGPARERVLTMLGRVGLADPERIADAYPHELSGGQRQRVCLAMALINGPEAIICDEPTTALDVTVQARVLTLLDEVLDAEEAACLFISHNLAVVSKVCSRVMVMQGGRIVEQGTVAQIFSQPAHPYTRGLVAAARIDQVEPGTRLPTVQDYWTRPDHGDDRGVES